MSMHDSLDTHCVIVGCTTPTTHTTEAHHCARCKRRGGCVCQRTIRACPQCKVLSEINLDNLLFTASECIVCYESAPSVVFSACRHTNVCRACALRLS